jgi:hypothetical protein
MQCTTSQKVETEALAECWRQNPKPSVSVSICVIQLIGRWVAQLVALFCYDDSSLGSNPVICQKYKMDDISPPKNIPKKYQTIESGEWELAKGVGALLYLWASRAIVPSVYNTL